MSPVNYVFLSLVSALQHSQLSRACTRKGQGEVEIGGVGELMNRSPSMTQRLLSASMKDQTNPRRGMKTLASMCSRTVL